jgi:nucleoside-diphosphate-sugar epimerase
MRALLTGATGFVGQQLAALLRDREHEVTALVRSPARAVPLAARGVRLVVGDLSNTSVLREACAGQEVVFHLAALTGAINEAEFLAANRDGTARLVEAALAEGRPRFVLVSSAAAGGPSAIDRPRTGRDEQPDGPVTGYGRSKLAGEAAVRGADIPWSILRPPAVYGPGDLANFLTVFRAARRFGIAPVFGDGSQQVSLVHVADLASAALAAAGHDAALGHTWYVNHPEILTTRELVQAIGREVGRDVTVVPLPQWVTKAALTATGAWAAAWRTRSILRADKAHEFAAAAWTGDSAPFTAATGWQAEFDHRRGFADTAAWYRAKGLL